MKPVSDEIRTLRRTMRDLVALSALPAVWAGYGPLQVAEGLADVLLSTLRLVLVYIRLPGQTEGQEIEVAHTAGGSTPTGKTRDIGRALAPWLDGAGIEKECVCHVPEQIAHRDRRAGRGRITWYDDPVGSGDQTIAISQTHKDAVALGTHGFQKHGSSIRTAVRHRGKGNANRVSLEDIARRQQLLGYDYDVLRAASPGDWRAPYTEDRTAFVRAFYQYARANPGGRPQLWSEWLKSGTD